MIYISRYLLAKPMPSTIYSEQDLIYICILATLIGIFNTLHRGHSMMDMASIPLDINVFSSSHLSTMLIILFWSRMLFTNKA